MDETLTFREHNARLSVAASRALGNVIGKTRELRDLGVYSYDKLVKSCVFSILDYGAEVRGFGYSKQLEDIQLRTAQFFLGVNKYCPLPCLNAEMAFFTS